MGRVKKPLINKTWNESLLFIVKFSEEKGNT